jgi:hypothetical protein
MLSSVLRSRRAVLANTAIMRSFVRLRELIASNKDIAARVEKLECSHGRTSSVIQVLVDEIDGLARSETDKSPALFAGPEIWLRSVVKVLSIW